MNIFRGSAAIVAVLALAATPALADDITDQLDSGKALYAKGDYAQALSELQFAINDIQKKVSERYVAVMPAAPAGWEADEPEAQSGAMLGGGQVITRHYHEQNGGEGQMTLTVSVDIPMIQAMSAMLTNPALISADPQAKRVRVGGDNAVLKWNAPNKSGEVTMMLGSRILAQLEGQNLKSDAVLQDFMKNWDMKPLKTAAGF
ncbi:MAG TPA: hypothetical protein VGD08_25290 [Stellaceae bacterium]